jgi:leader peptidase (prepilin peptidase) / N-methyltransferase
VIEAVLALVFGLLIGSFLNVCIHRWPRDFSVVRPRSRCPACEKTIAWYDNIPIASYLALRGRCRHCGTPISWRYPVVELLTGLLFFYFVRELGLTPAALKMCAFSAMLVALIFSDLEMRILPDELTLGGTLAGLVFSAFVPMPESIVPLAFWLATRQLFGQGVQLSGRAHSFVEATAGAAVPAFLLWVAGWFYERVRHREGLGFGDVKLIAMVGSFLGLSGALLTLAGGSLAGSIIGYAYIRVTRKDPSTYELPLGTFLSIAALALGLAAPRVLNWYGSL